MDTQQLRQLKPKLRKFLSQFDDCFLGENTRCHLPTYVEGQLSDLPDKSVEPIATKAGVAPTLQEFLTHLKWDQESCAIGCRTSSGANTAVGMASASSTRRASSRRGTRRRACNGNGAAPTARRELPRHRPPGIRLRRLPLPARRARCFCRKTGRADRQRCREAAIP